jgi:hypothetical protein
LFSALCAHKSHNVQYATLHSTVCGERRRVEATPADFSSDAASLKDIVQNVTLLTDVAAAAAAWRARLADATAAETLL